MGADLFETIPEDPYPEDYQETIERCHQERDMDARPKIDGEILRKQSFLLVRMEEVTLQTI